jgi:hypothetical protein
MNHRNPYFDFPLVLKSQRVASDAVGNLAYSPIANLARFRQTYMYVEGVSNATPY